MLKKPGLKDHMMYGFICLKCLEHTNLHRLGEIGGKWGVLVGRGFLFQGNKNVLELHIGDGCTALNIFKKY